MIKTFEEIGSLTEKQTIALFDKVEEDVMVISLKMSSEALREKLFASIGEQPAQKIAKKMEALGAVRVDDVESNQKLVIEVANTVDGLED